MSPTPDQISTAMIGVASVGVAALSFIYASKAQAATRRAESVQAHVADATIDAQAYQRARDLYESAIKQINDQNESLRTQVHDLQDEIDRLRHANTTLEERIAQLEHDNPAKTRKPRPPPEAPGGTRP